LDTRKPITLGDEFLSGCHCAKSLIAQYPEAQEIVDLFDAYKRVTEEEARKRTTTNNHSFNCSGPWHMWSAH
jgi:hypothetical protein